MQVLDVTASHLFADEPVMRKVEYWRWRYHDAETGLVRPTPFQMLETEARTTYGEVERIEGSMTLRAVPRTALTPAGRPLGGKPCRD